MENRFEHFTLDIFNISKYWNKIASEEMREYGLRGAHALYLLMLDGYEILELARTGVAGLGRGIDKVVYLE